MKRYAANFLLDESGALLKNGILESDDSGNILRIVDTKGDLREAAQLTFQNGMLLSGYSWVKTGSAKRPGDLPEFFVETDLVSMQSLIDAGKTFQKQFPEKTISHFFSETYQFLSRPEIYRKIPEPGVFLLTGIDLVNMKFTPKSRLKKLL